MPVKYGKTTIQIDRNTKKKSISHEYMKQKTIDELVEFYNENKKPKLKRKVKIEIERRNKLGKSNIIFS